MNGLYYGDDNIQVSKIDYAIIDTGTSLLYMGTSDYQKFLQKLYDSDHGSELNCEDLTYCYSEDHECDYFIDSMEPLTIVLGNNHYSMPPEAYMFTGDG